jgi:hypothetical protein
MTECQKRLLFWAMHFIRPGMGCQCHSIMQVAEYIMSSCMIRCRLMYAAFIAGAFLVRGLGVGIFCGLVQLHRC